ncbi:hypothetical protein FA95DRAFT_1127559 [Auriscalpium vulgare]|uniref:Uncharacterized protein n=1 Tax=Auriscalpium vulgare TaxID=40419 RepID=A0ACB8R483_9AGAM|nr:hypothetical protein FA95DRAFT_1127559 [Auriscalpium vulgare]
MDEDIVQDNSKRVVIEDRTQWPKWLVNDHDHLLEAISDEDGWATLVGRWGVIEELMGFPSGQGKKLTLSTTSRPAEVARWLRSRNNSKPPLIKDVEDFANRWRLWWIGLQPEWRGSEWPLTRESHPSEEWTHCKIGGRNGFGLVLMTLSWWYGAAMTETEQREWESALEDVSWVAETIIAHLQGRQQPVADNSASKENGVGDKRSAETSGDITPPAKRQKSLRTRRGRAT